MALASGPGTLINTFKDAFSKWRPAAGPDDPTQRAAVEAALRDLCERKARLVKIIADLGGIPSTDVDFDTVKRLKKRADQRLKLINPEIALAEANPTKGILADGSFHADQAGFTCTF